MRLTGRLAIPALVLAVWACGSVWAVQESDEASEAQPAAAEEQPGKLEWLRFYVSVARGAADADAVNSSVTTSATRDSENTLSLDGQVFNRAAFGYQLKKGKGDFRVIFTAFKEDGYDFTAFGRENRVLRDSTSIVDANDNLTWWSVHVINGDLTSEMSQPRWTLANDVAQPNAQDPSILDPPNGRADCDLRNGPEFCEVTYLADPDIAISRTITDNLQNRLQNIDMVYGRTFGKRRFTGHWWGGLRYSIYEGNVPVAAWLRGGDTPPAGEGFTSGGFLKFINFNQQFTGAGGTGAIEFDFNFFNDRLSLFAGSQFAFIFGNLDADSGDFATTIPDDSQSVTLTVPAHLTATRRKTTWQTGLDLGAKINLKNGLQIEAAYFIMGHLDVVLLPTEILIPEGELDAGNGSSALYNTQDLVIDGWRAGLNFQF